MKRDGSGEEGGRQRGQVAESGGWSPVLRGWVPVRAGCSVPQFLLCPAEILLASHSQVTLEG